MINVVDVYPHVGHDVYIILCHACTAVDIEKSFLLEINYNIIIIGTSIVSSIVPCF